MKKVTIVVPKENGVSYHRLTGPFSWLHVCGKIKLTVINGITKEFMHRVDKMDILVFNRFIDPMEDSLETIHALQEQGVKVWCDVDDYWHLHGGHLLEGLYRSISVPKHIEASIKASDIVTCTHEHLAKKIRKLNPNVQILPNAINHHEANWKHVGMKETNFGWMGSSAHRKDIEILLRPLKRYWQGESKWNMLYAGFSQGSVKESMEFERLLTGGHKAPKERYFRAHQLPVDEYPKLLNEITCALIPLADNEFNRCKSELKVLEFAAKGKAVIVSNIHPYSNIVNEDNAYLCKEPMDFYRHMMRVERNPLLAQAKALKLQADCRELYNWDKVSYLRFQIIENLWH